MLRPGGRVVVGIGDPETMARLPGLTVEHRRMDEQPMPRYLFIGGRAA